MSNASIGLTLEAASHANESAKLIAEDNTWSSSAGGWLPNSGTWIQSVDGVRLIASDGKVHAFCEGLTFLTCDVWDRGNGHYLQIGDFGHWEVGGTRP